jgi:hypothetical protein
VNYTGTRRPEVDTVAFRRRLKEVEDLLVRVDTRCQILFSTAFANDQVVAVNAGGDGGTGHIAGYELQKSHLGRSILHIDAVRAQLEVGLAADILAVVGIAEQRLLYIVQMAVEDLFG